MGCCTADHPERILITCRVRSYIGEAVLSNFQAFTLAPFDEGKIGKFVHGWYTLQENLGRLNAVQAKDKADNLTRAALTSDLHELSSNPMMLTSMAIIHQKEIGLPKERVRLYKLIVDVLLLRWQKQKVSGSELGEFLKNDLLLRSVMERLAYEAHTSGKGEKEAADLPRGLLLTLLERREYFANPKLADEFLDYVDERAGLFSWARRRR